MSRIYEKVPAPTVETCEQLLRAYVDDEPLTCDPRLLSDPLAALFAEAVVLQAVEMLIEDRGSSADLLFAPLTDSGVFVDAVPAMPALLRFLRARLAGQAPVLRLDPTTPQLAYPLLLLAAQALRSAQEEVPDAVRRCLARLAADPAEERTPAGDLAYGLTPDADVDNDRYFRDELRKALSQAIPARRALTTPDGTVLLVVDLASRPDVADLFRMLVTDPPAAGAETATSWSVFAGTETTIARLDVAWFEPVRAQLAVYLDADLHGPALDRIATSSTLALTDVDPHERPDAMIPSIQIPGDPERVRALLDAAAARRAPR